MNKNDEKKLQNEFNYPMPSNDEDNQGDFEYEKILEKEIESSCTFNKYIDKLEMRNDLTDDQLISEKTKEEIVSYKNEQMNKLKAYIASLEQEKEDLINSFKNTTNALLEKIKDLESKNYFSDVPQNIERPQTAAIVEQLNNNNISQNNNNKKQRCPNCQKEILESEFVAHSLVCLRHSFRCKKCGELVNDSNINDHINSFFKTELIYDSIKNGDKEKFILILEHGLKNDKILSDNGDYIYHTICRFNRSEFLKELINRKIIFNLNTVNNDKETPLIIAITCNNLKCAEILIKLGCDVNLRNKSDLSPLMLVCKYGYKNLFELLLSKGADINDKNILGETPLSLAQANHHDDLAMLILKQSQLKFNK